MLLLFIYKYLGSIEAKYYLALYVVFLNVISYSNSVYRSIKCS